MKFPTLHAFYPFPLSLRVRTPYPYDPLPVGLFDRVVLLINVGNTVSIVCHSCQEGAGNRTKEAYRRRITGEGRSYAERQRERIECVECGELLAVGSMSSHLMTRHGKSAARRQLWTPQADGGPRTYKMSFPEKGGPRAAPGKRRPWEQAAPVERSGTKWSGRKIDLSGRDPSSESFR